MLRLAYALFALILIAVAAFIMTTSSALPDRVASHFAGNGLANGWMSRDGYMTFVLVFAVGLPLLVGTTIGVLPRAMRGSINVPNRDYWLAPARQQQTLDFLSIWGIALGCLVAVFIAVIHSILIAANAAVPPRLPPGLFAGALIAFLAGIVVWIVAILIRFRRGR